MKHALVLSLPFVAAIVVAGACGGSTFSSAGSTDASIEGAGDDVATASSSSSGSSSGSSGSGSGSGSSTSSGSGSSGGATSSSGSGSGGSSGGSGGGCTPACGTGRVCCDGACVNLFNNPDHCGTCGTKCPQGTYCNGGCKPIPCVDGGACAAGGTCCGTSCCTAGQLCCESAGPVSNLYPVCVTPTAAQPTCPAGCSPLCVSDRNLKRDIEPVDEQAVLETVATVPVSTWSYKSDDPAVRHLGPMAQDFYAAFGLGDTDRAYNPIDAHGVALAAIQALYERSRAQDARIERLEQENHDLRAAARRDAESCKP